MNFLLVLLRLIIAWAHFSGFCLAASLLPPVTVACPTTSQLKSHALPTPNSISLTKPCYVDQGWGAVPVSWPEIGSAPSPALPAPSSPTCILWPVRHLEGSFGGQTVHCVFTPHRQRWSTGCGQPCHACLYLPSALIPGALHNILLRNPDSKGKRNMALLLARRAGSLEVLYFIFPPCFPGKCFNN